MRYNNSHRSTDHILLPYIHWCLSRQRHEWTSMPKHKLAASRLETWTLGLLPRTSAKWAGAPIKMLVGIQLNSSFYSHISSMCLSWALGSFRRSRVSVSGREKTQQSLSSMSYGEVWLSFRLGHNDSSETTPSETHLIVGRYRQQNWNYWIIY